jgi:hypothetical protein
MLTNLPSKRKQNRPTNRGQSAKQPVCHESFVQFQEKCLPMQSTFSSTLSKTLDLTAL